MASSELVKCPCCEYPAHKSNIQPLIDKWEADHQAALAEAREDNAELTRAVKSLSDQLDTEGSLAAELTSARVSRDRIKNAARFLLDMLTESNETVDALYGRSDTLEQAAIELRALLSEGGAS